MRNFLSWTLCYTIAWWILLLPFHYNLFSGITDPVHSFFYWIIQSVAQQDIPFHSDSSGMYALLLVCPILGIISSALISGFLPKKWKSAGLFVAGQLVLYYLVFNLWEYGWIKVTKVQFYLPEPNTVYTSLGNLSRDIAYWSVIGSSWLYVFFLGMVELITGTLLLFRRTRFVGLLLSAGIFLNVLMVNISFDISVKVFSFTLLLMTAVLLTTYPNQWRNLFQLPVGGTNRMHTYPGSTAKRWLQPLVLSLFVMEIVYPTVLSGEFNDDAAERIEHQGAYSIVEHPVLKKLFVHSRGYVIVETQNGSMTDYRITETGENVWCLVCQRSQQKSEMRWIRKNTLTWSHGSVTDTLNIQVIPYRQLPLLKPSFHLVSDEFH